MGAWSGESERYVEEMAVGHCPLGPEDCAALNTVLESAAVLRHEIQRCKQCGIPVEDQEARLEMVAGMAAKIKAAWFPDQP